MTTDFQATMAEADRQLETDLQRIFGDLDARLLPSAAVADIHSHGICEDGETLSIMCDMADATTMLISICPGRPITACIV